MTSNSALLVKETTMNIDFKNSESVSDLLLKHLQEEPKSWIAIQGFHSIASQQTSQLEQVVDFDLKIKGVNAQLTRIEVEGVEGDPQVFSTNRSPQSSIVLDEEIVQKFSQAVIDLLALGSYNRIIIKKDTSGIDHTAIEKCTTSAKKHVVYGGNVNITSHDTTSLTTIQSQALQTEGNSMSIKTSWIFEWPGLEYGISTSTNTPNDQQPQRRKQTWSGRLQAAMVDNEHGWIVKDDSIPPGIQFTRALKKYNLIYDRVQDSIHYENGVQKGSSGTMRFHRWGCDESK